MIGETLSFIVIYAAVIDLQMESNLYLDETDFLSFYVITIANSIHAIHQIMFVFISIVAMIVQMDHIYIVLIMIFVKIAIHSLNTNRNSGCQTEIIRFVFNRNMDIVIVLVDYTELVNLDIRCTYMGWTNGKLLEGFSVMDGPQYDGIFMKSVCRVFKSYKDVQNLEFKDFIFKIRQYTCTKEDSTLNNNIFNDK